MSKRSFESSIYHDGQEVETREALTQELAEHQKQSVELFRELFNEVKENRKTPNIVFDLDGTLIQSEDYETGSSTPLETGKNKQSIEEWLGEHEQEVKQFQKTVSKLHHYGFEFGINTGRGIEFAKRVAEQLFPNGSLRSIVGESGAAILETNGNGSWNSKLTIPESVEAESYETLATNKSLIEKISLELGGLVEPGKEVIVSINPPDKTTTEEFENLLKERLQEAGVNIEQLNIAHSASAVDVGPKGASKIASLKQLLGEGLTIYFGDASNDQEAMRGSVVNVAPGNAQEVIRETAKKELPIDEADPKLVPGFGVIVDDNKRDLSGSIQGLKSIELYWRYENQRENSKTGSAG